jgi:hypothetical protein
MLKMGISLTSFSPKSFNLGHKLNILAIQNGNSVIYDAQAKEAKSGCGDF